ncbi:hypothetical protein AAG906_034836 [Vitis piasezkii]
MENVESDDRSGSKGEDEEEEEKIEQFFALIRSFRDAQNRRMSELNEMEERRKKKKRKMDEEPSTWVPAFRFEDFNEEIEFRRPPLIFPGKRKEDKKVEDQEDEGGLNLKLTL